MSNSIAGSARLSGGYDSSSYGVLKVTGRDVPEAEYALTIADGKTWQLDGATLRAAAARARQREESQDLGETSVQVLAVIREHPEGIRANELVPRFGKDVYKYLQRLTEAGRIDKPHRGLYVAVSETSGPSEPQVSAPAESDTADQVSDSGELWPEGSHGEAAS